MQRAANPFDAEAGDDELPEASVSREEQLYRYLKELGTTPADYYSLLNLPRSVRRRARGRQRMRHALESRMTRR